MCLRYGNIVGPRLGHGITHDLIVKLRRNPEELEVLGDGTQTRSYLHVEDTIDATLRVLPEKGFHAFNVGNMTTITVDEVVSIVIATPGLTSVKITHKPTENGAGWSGDMKQITLDFQDHAPRLENQTFKWRCCGTNGQVANDDSHLSKGAVWFGSQNTKEIFQQSPSISGGAV